ncbi:hypothetical protein JW758_02820 [Candidatus Peregrinibacteria bacterium]|nr:hypothetical protein [Candidatus Peregrinibacteria bacterium]
MKKIIFTSLAFCISISLLLFANAIDNTITKDEFIKIEKPDIVRAIYLTVNSVSYSNFPKIIDQVIESGGNAVVMDIEHGGGKLAFEPKNEYVKMVNPGSQTLNNLKETVDYLHSRGIYAIARQVVFNDPYASTRKPEWRIKYRWGGLYDYRWLDPSKAGVQNYNLLIMDELAQFGFDEIQFDYIRFPAANHNTLDYWYDEEAFKNSDVINHYLKRARIIADKYDIDISVDTFGAVVFGDVDSKIVGQSIPEIAQIVDAIYPMTYPSHYSPGYNGIYDMYYAPYTIVYESIKRFIEQANGNAEIRPYIQGFALRAQNFGTKYIADQIQAGYDAGAKGFAIWNASNSYSYSWATLNMEPDLIEEPEEPNVPGIDEPK